jgi:hypothetical protein
MSLSLKAFLAAMWLVSAFYLMSPTIYTYFNLAWSGYFLAPPGAENSTISHLTRDVVAWYSVQ